MGVERTQPFTNFRERRLTGPRSLFSRARAHRERRRHATGIQGMKMMENNRPVLDNAKWRGTKSLSHRPLAELSYGVYRHGMDCPAAAVLFGPLHPQPADPEHRIPQGGERDPAEAVRPAPRRGVSGGPSAADQAGRADWPRSETPDHNRPLRHVPTLGPPNQKQGAMQEARPAQETRGDSCSWY